MLAEGARIQESGGLYAKGGNACKIGFRVTFWTEIMDYLLAHRWALAQRRRHYS
jgi:hypothetical protein